jgi:peroxiredoxin
MINIDEEATDFWVGLHLPTLPISATNGQEITLAESVEHRIYGPVVVYCYPQINLSDIAEVGGGRQQTYAFRDRFQEFKKLGITIYGLSTEDTAYQKEIVQRLALPFDLLSDSEPAAWGSVSNTLGLPRFQIDGKIFLKHMTFIVEKNKVIKIFEPVTVPEKNAEEVLAWFYNQYTQAEKVKMSTSVVN